LLVLPCPRAYAKARPIRVNALLIKPIRVPMLPLLSGMDHHYGKGLGSHRQQRVEFPWKTAWARIQRRMPPSALGDLVMREDRIHSMWHQIGMVPLVYSFELNRLAKPCLRVRLWSALRRAIGRALALKD